MQYTEYIYKVCRIEVTHELEMAHGLNSPALCYPAIIGQMYRKSVSLLQTLIPVYIFGIQWSLFQVLVGLCQGWFCLRSCLLHLWVKIWCAWFEKLRVFSLVFADDMAHDLEPALRQFAVKCEAARRGHPSIHSLSLPTSYLHMSNGHCARIRGRFFISEVIGVEEFRISLGWYSKLVDTRGWQIKFSRKYVFGYKAGWGEGGGAIK